MNAEILKKARKLKERGFYVVTSIKEKTTGNVGTASLVDEDVWVKLLGEDNCREEFFVSMEEFNQAFEIIMIDLDTGRDSVRYKPNEFLM